MVQKRKCKAIDSLTNPDFPVQTSGKSHSLIMSRQREPWGLCYKEIKRENILSNQWINFEKKFNTNLKEYIHRKKNQFNSHCIVKIDCLWIDKNFPVSFSLLLTILMASQGISLGGGWCNLIMSKRIPYVLI